MNSIVEESREDLDDDQEEGAISILKEPLDPVTKEIQDSIKKNGLSPRGTKQKKQKKKGSQAGLLQDKTRDKSSHPLTLQ